jgi:hypothetical protein
MKALVEVFVRSWVWDCDLREHSLARGVGLWLLPISILALSMELSRNYDVNRYIKEIKVPEVLLQSISFVECVGNRHG